MEVNMKTPSAMVVIFSLSGLSVERLSRLSVEPSVY